MGPRSWQVVREHPGAVRDDIAEKQLPVQPVCEGLADALVAERGRALALGVPSDELVGGRRRPRAIGGDGARDLDRLGHSAEVDRALPELIDEGAAFSEDEAGALVDELRKGTVNFGG